MKSNQQNPVSVARAFVALLVDYQGARLAGFVVWCGLLGLLNGVALLLLIPLVEVAGIPGASADSQRGLASFFRATGWGLSIEAAVVIFLVVAIVYAVVSRCSNLSRNRLELAFVKALQDRTFAAIAMAEWSYFSQQRRSDFTHLLTSNLDRVSTATFYFLRLIASVVLALIHLGVAFLLSPGLALFASLCGLGVAALLHRQNRAAAEAGAEVTKHSEQLHSQIANSLHGMKEAKSMGAERQQIENFQTHTARLAEGRLRFGKVRETTHSWHNVVAALVLAVLLVIAVRYLRIPPSELLVFILIFSRLAPRGRDIHLSYQRLLHAMPAVSAVIQLQQECDAVAEASDVATVGGCDLRTGIELIKVSYRYPGGRDNWALRDVSLTVPAFQTTAIVGASGAGKSTLADLLLGLTAPSAGQMLVDGRPWTPPSPKAWRESVGYVPQQTFLLHDTIRTNLLWARPEATEAEMWEALDSAAAREFVEQLPNGLDTLVGDRGSQLSGGESQRLALARALLRRPTLLVLDEPTSELDPFSQGKIRTALANLHATITIVIVAHRLSLIGDADQVIVFDAGRVAEMGTIDSLLAGGSRFRELLDAEAWTHPAG